MDFTVIAMQVPDETKKGQYHVGLYRTASDPTTLASVTPIFLATAVKSDQRALVLPPQKFKKGEWLAALGAAGPNTGNVFNSYGATGTVPSQVLGNPIGLKRLMLQTNIAVSKGVGSLATNTSNIARVRLYVVGQGDAMPYGKSSGPNPGALVVSDPNPPSIGGTGAMVVMPGVATNTGGLYAIGIKQTSVVTPAGTFLTAPLAVLGLPGTTIPATGTKISFAIPKQNSLLGLKLYFQAAERQGNNFSLTNGMGWTVNN
ncbi:MAG: hypothetical protein ACYTGW_03130 [Planctomycetota bacterium]